VVKIVLGSVARDEGRVAVWQYPPSDCRAKTSRRDVRPGTPTGDPVLHTLVSGFAGSRECTQLGISGKLQEISAAIGLHQLVGRDRRLSSRRTVFAQYCAELTGVGLRFEPNADASSLCFASACCTSADHKAAVLDSVRDHAIQARDYYNPPQHLHPDFMVNPELPLKLTKQVAFLDRHPQTAVCFHPV
jgi:dTDP-4-amino-4,6-dideoxygalactose transaminase